MAARRLLFMLIAILVISSFAAALVPVERATRTDSTAPAPKPAAGAEPSGGRIIERRVDAGARRAPTVRIPLGDQLVLTVAADRLDQVEIPALGELEDVEPSTPAAFDLLPVDPGRYAVRIVDADRRVATIEVEPPKRSEKGLEGDQNPAQDREPNSGQNAREKR